MIRSLTFAISRRAIGVSLNSPFSDEWRAPIDADDEDLKAALRSYVLSGAIKLFRQSRDPQRYKGVYFRHHTMLVHTSQSRGAHASLADRLKDLWGQAALKGPTGLDSIRKLWKDDYVHVCGAQGSELVPASFDELIPHLSDAIKKIEHGLQMFLVVNSDDPAAAPDFSEAPVWKVIVGGNKLSRGYTIEGLTVSYYRRISGTGRHADADGTLVRVPARISRLGSRVPRSQRREERRQRSGLSLQGSVSNGGAVPRRH